MPQSLLLLLYAALLGAVLGGCASAPDVSGKPIYWPDPPNPPRFVYETVLRSAGSVRLSTRSDRMESLLTGRTADDVEVFSKPFDVAAYRGRIVVTDTVKRAAIMFDVTRGKVYPFGVRDEGRLQKPLGVGIGPNELIYIADITARDVKVYDKLGLHLFNIGSGAVFERPVDVAVAPDGEKIYVLDAGGIDKDVHQVLVFDKEGQLQGRFGSRGTESGQFNLPTQLDVGVDGQIYVLDAGNFRVQVFDAEGQFLRAWGKVGRNLGDLARPRGIAVGRDGNVYVTDAAFQNFQVFNNQGELLMWIGGSGFEDRPGQYTIPAGIAVDETNRVYVVDQYFRKVEVMRLLSDAESAAAAAAR